MRPTACLPILAALVLAASANAQVKLKEIGDEAGVGRNLSGEECKLRLTERLTVANVPIERFGLFCGTWRQPSALAQSFRGSDRFNPMAFIVDGNWARAYQQRLADCDPAQPGTVLSGNPAAFRTCRNRDLGFPVVAFTTRFEGNIWTMETLPTNLAVAERAIAVMSGKQPPSEAREGSRTALIRSWETIHKTEAARITASDANAVLELRELGLSQVYARRLGDAEKTFRQLLDAWGRLIGNDHPSLGRIYGDLGLTYYLMNRLEDSERVLVEASKRARLSPRADDEGLVLTYRGGLALRTGDKEAALALVREGLQVRRDRKLNARALGQSVLFELEALNALGRYEEAVTAGEETLRLLIPGYGNAHPLVGNTHVALGIAKLRLGRLAEARAEMERAVALREKLFGDGSRLGQSLLELARVVREERGAAAAYPIIDRAIAVTAKESPGGLGITVEQAGMAIATLLKASAEAPGQTPHALELAAIVAQQPGAGVTSDAINKMAARLEASDAATGNAARALQDAIKREIEIRTRLARLQNPEQDEKRDTVREKQLQGELEKAVAQVANAEQRLQAGFPRYAALVATQPAQPAELGQLLKPDEALVQILPTRFGTYTIVIRAGGKVTVGASPSRDQAIEEQVAQLRAGLDWQGGRERPFDLALAHRLYKDLFGSVQPALAGATRLIVVPGGALQSLPPGVLLTEPSKGTGYAGQPWLARRHVISVATSLRSFAQLRRAGAKPPAPEPYIGIGDPSFAGAAGDQRGLGEVLAACRMDEGIDAAVLRKLPRLPETRDEVQAVARALGAQSTATITGAKATEAAIVTTDLSRYRVVHFATHGLLAGEARCLNEPALALAPPERRVGRVDGLLEASEVANLRLDADWVVLSACNTAGPGGDLAGEALSGLARAFFYAGARAVLASHWPVFSKPTTALMARTFDAYAGKREAGRAAALRAGMLTLMDQPATAHPAVWAAFVVVADS
ncbi:CHAT domain-containing tetratricopeptide repeat protein [Desertibaculum subflavum]|uniref:CHAT domain-containing tetratricopeptide repeat protein n=1 Tax=Desertibaculum subflavum TaxID=2268458 RepID=UPI000E66F068